MTQRNSVYVIGAGFSAGLGFPLTSDLLVRLWDRIDTDLRSQLERVIRFHHPGFDSDKFTSFPNVEQLLSEMQVNDQLFHASRQYEGKFTKQDLKDLQRNFLMQVAHWFHELAGKICLTAPKDEWLKRFRDRIVAEDAAIISFNWDLVLDQLLFGDAINAASYGLAGDSDGPILLKPHGSLNWFEGKLGEYLKDNRRTRILDDSEGSNRVYAFRKFRSPISKKGREYTPILVPPVYLKNFETPIFKLLWQNCVRALSQARKVIFLGYSMPLADVHAQLIMRYGFHNQVEGMITKAANVNGNRETPVGPAKVVIVNPDEGAARRIAAITGPKNKCKWVSTPISIWMDEG